MGARGRRKERRARARTTGRRGEGAGGAQAGARDLSFAGRLPHPGGKSRRRTDAAASRGPAPERSAPGRGSGGGEGRETGPRGRGTAPPNDPRGSLSLSLPARTGRARGGGGRAGPAGGQAGSRLPPHRRRGERPRRRGFPPPSRAQTPDRPTPTRPHGGGERARTGAGAAERAGKEPRGGPPGRATTAGREDEARADPRGAGERRTPPTSELRETEGPGERGPASRLPAARRDPPRGGETARGGGD